MAIRKITIESITRRRIGFFEEDPPENAIKNLNEFEVCTLNGSSIQNVKELSNVATVIFRQDSNKPYSIARHLADYANDPI